MTSKPSSRITVENNDKVHTLFSILEKKDGNIVVTAKLPTFVKGLAGEGRIKEVRFSVHISNKSDTRINAIQWTRVAENSPDPRSKNYTKAVKANSGFAQIGHFRIMNPIHLPFTPDDQRPRISLGTMDSRFSTLFMCLSVSSKQVLFPEVNLEDMSVTSFTTEYFRFTVLTSYAPIPSHPSHDGYTVITLPPDLGIVGSEVGVTADELIMSFRRLRNALFDQLGRKLTAEVAGWDSRPEWQMARMFFKSGIPDQTWAGVYSAVARFSSTLPP